KLKNCVEITCLTSEPENVSCGEICSLTAKSKTSGLFYPLLKKPVNCLHMIHLLHKTPTWQDSHTRNINKDGGSQRDHIDYNILSKVYEEDYINELVLMESNGNEDNELADSLVRRTFSAYEGVFYNKRGIVLGSQTPWIEAMLLCQHVKHLITLDNNVNIVFIHPKISKYNPFEFSELFLQSRIQHFDFAVSYDFVDQSQIDMKENTYGDLQTVAQVWCVLKPRGLFFLAVPESHNQSSYTTSNSQRVYANDRLQHLTANFNVLDHFRSGKVNGKIHFGMWVLQKIDT
ncbi:unnamed protein product, partial [Owenia fusiformis]